MYALADKRYRATRRALWRSVTRHVTIAMPRLPCHERVITLRDPRLARRVTQFPYGGWFYFMAVVAFVRGFLQYWRRPHMKRSALSTDLAHALREGSARLRALRLAFCGLHRVGHAMGCSSDAARLLSSRCSPQHHFSPQRAKLRALPFSRLPGAVALPPQFFSRFLLGSRII